MCGIEFSMLGGFAVGIITTPQSGQNAEDPRIPR